MPNRFNVAYWKGRADEMRAVADDTQDPTAETIMLQIAGDFDRLVEHLYRQASKGKASEQDRSWPLLFSPFWRAVENG